MTAVPSYQAGNWIRCSVVFTPQSGTVNLADVKAWTIVNRVAVDITAAAANVSGGVLAGAVDPVTRAITATANCFYVDVFIPDATPKQTWTIRWESETPSPRISIEQTSFYTLASLSPSP